VTDFDEKTRVTQVIQGKPDDEPAETGNDSLVVIYTKEPTLLGKRFVLDSCKVRACRGADNAIVLEGDSVTRQHAHFVRMWGIWYGIDV
jgi:hypothetical protein